MSFNPVQAARMADFIQFAYNMYGDGSTLKPIPDPGIEAAGYQLTFWLTAHDFEEQAFYGYIAQSKVDPSEIIVAIRGTRNTAEWVLDFSALPVFFHADASVGSVALGFQSIQQTFAFADDAGVVSSLADVIARVSAAQAIRSITILGHSLGAALATLAAAELAARNTVGVKALLTVYTFASPRVGLLDFAAWFNSNISACYRIWNLLDVVPEIPTFPYIHVSVFGDRLTQSAEQLAILQKTPRCEHDLRSYQWLLDPASFSLDSGCSTSVPQTSISAGASPVDTSHLLGAIALKKAGAGRV